MPPGDMDLSPTPMPSDHTDLAPIHPSVTVSGYKPPPGRLGNLVGPQESILEELKKQLKEEGDFVEERMDDAALLKFLRARKFDLAKAKDMVLRAEDWRKTFGVDDIMAKGEVVVNSSYKQFYHKTDRDGRPIYIERLANLKAGALPPGWQQPQLRRLVYEYEKFITERLPACSRAAGYPVETSCTILDLGNASVADFTKVQGYVIEASTIGQNYYPESMGKFYIINTPWAFTLLWAGIKIWLDPVTQEKITVLGSEYKTELLKQIDEANLPAVLNGGKCVCAGGCELSNAGPWNPDAGPDGEITAPS